MASLQPTPFKPGDRVVYRPSQRGLDMDANYSGSSRLMPGAIYTVAEIQRQCYVLVDGYAHPQGGLYWTEFVAAGAV